MCLWKSGTLSPLNTMFICTLQTSSTKIILLTSPLHPRRASIHTVNFGGSVSPPRLDLIKPGLWYYNRNAYYRRNVALFCPCREQEGGKTYFEGLNNYFVKQTKYRVNTVDLGAFRLPQPMVKLKWEVNPKINCIGREALWSCHWRQDEVLRLFFINW